MAKIDIEYVKKFFKYIEENERVVAPYNAKISEGFDEVKRGFGPFLDSICDYADSEDVDIPENISTDHYTDNRYYYFIGYEGKVLEIGMYFDHNLIYAQNPSKEYKEEDIIDCKKMIKRKRYNW